MYNEHEMFESFEDWKHEYFHVHPEILQGQLRQYMNEENLSSLNSLFRGMYDYNSLGAALQAMSDGSFKAPSGESLPCNTWPFGEPTSTIHPTFFGVCYGDADLTPALNQVVNYCIAVSRALPVDQRKDVILLTDKWLPKKFAAVEQLLTYLAITNNIAIHIYLVTDYGCTRIPFLDNRRTYHKFPLDKITVKRNSIKEANNIKVPRAGHIKKANLGRILFYISGNSFQNYSRTYIYDLEKGEKYYSVDSGWTFDANYNPAYDRKLSDNEVKWISNQLEQFGSMPPVSSSRELFTDHTEYIIECFGKKVRVSAAQLRHGDNARINKLVQVLEEITRNC